MTLSIGRVQSPRIIRIGGGVVRETADVMAQLEIAARKEFSYGNETDHEDVEDIDEGEGDTDAQQ